MKTYTEKLDDLKDLITIQRREDYTRRGFTHEVHDADLKVRVVLGKKYAKIDVGSGSGYSGKYMIDEDGNIFGCKAYGVINKKHCYGTLDTINDWYWGEYVAYKKEVK